MRLIPSEIQEIKSSTKSICNKLNERRSDLEDRISASDHKNIIQIETMKDQSSNYKTEQKTVTGLIELNEKARDKIHAIKTLHRNNNKTF